MIRELRIRNLAIIEALDLEFDPQLNILSGETGAGKSIILGALRLVLGERASNDDIRTGSDSAEAEALIDGPLSPKVLALLDEAGIACEDGGLILRREINRGGKSKSIINGRLAPLHQLRTLGALLIDLHGQHQHQSLLDSENHIEALDAFAETAPQLAKMADAHKRWAGARESLRRMLGDERALEREKSMLEHQLSEIEQAGLSLGEDDKISAERSRLRNAEKLRESSERAQELLAEGQGGGPSALEILARAEAEILAVAELDESQRPRAEDIAELRYRLEDLAAQMRDYAKSAESDPARLSAIEDRLDLIRGLKRKYGGTIQEILDAQAQYSARLQSITHRDDEIARLESAFAESERTLSREALCLSETRKKAAQKFERQLVRELSQLQMERARFSVQFSSEEAPRGEGAVAGGQRVVIGPGGMDRVEFLLSTNPGESLKPLRRIASGGELSRIMLALKSLLARRDAIPTLIFDEIDTGISGATAQVVGEKMRRLAQSHQVICITHLPQIASRATRHFVVEKTERGKRMQTQVRALSEDERVSEIARLLGGDADSSAGLKHAEELLAKKTGA